VLCTGPSPRCCRVTTHTNRTSKLNSNFALRHRLLRLESKARTQLPEQQNDAREVPEDNEDLTQLLSSDLQRWNRSHLPRFSRPLILASSHPPSTSSLKLQFNMQYHPRLSRSTHSSCGSTSQLSCLPPPAGECHNSCTVTSDAFGVNLTVVVDALNLVCPS
jgi:hypothetical protein